MNRAHRIAAHALLALLYLAAVAIVVQLVAAPRIDASLGDLAAVAMAVRLAEALAIVVCVAGAASVHAILARE